MSTPYELRFKVLEMARDLCMDDHNQKAYAFWQIHAKIEEVMDGSHMNENKVMMLRDIIDDLVAASPPAPTPDMIIDKAKELYEFVSTK